MPFKSVYFSQQDPKWKDNALGSGDIDDTIGAYGCALTSLAMLLSGHGYAETPKTLNEKLTKANGFFGTAIIWSAVNKIYPNVTLKASIPCADSDAPLAQIDAALAAGQPVIVQVDSSPGTGIQTHWVLLYQRDGEDYLIFDPWPYPTISKPDFLMKQYAQGLKLEQAILHVVLYEALGDSPNVPSARVKASVTKGLNLRSSIDTSSMNNIVCKLSAGTQVILLESDGYYRVGAINQMLRIRAKDKDVYKDGYVAAWYLEDIPDDDSDVEVETPTTTSSTPPQSTPPPPTPHPPTFTCQNKDHKSKGKVHVAVGRKQMKDFDDKFDCKKWKINT
jgi:hypothetical protein